MPRMVNPRLMFAAIALVLSSGSFLRAQQSAENSPAPLPSQIVSARKVFISNAGQEINPNAGILGKYSGGINRTYNQFYSALKSWGRFELVSNPAQSDLVLELRFTDPMAPASVIKGDTVGPTDDAQFRLVILDPKTHIALWAFTEHVESAKLQGHRDKNFDQALGKVIDDLKNLAAQPAVEANQ